jgi:hypothetical protein
MSDANRKPSVKQNRPETASRIQRFGFYANTFTAAEMRLLELETEADSELNLLRTRILRLAKLTPLRKINDKELEAVIKLVRIVAMMDSMERTGLLARKQDGSADPLAEVMGSANPEEA